MVAFLLRIRRRIQRLLKVQSESRQKQRSSAKTRTIKIVLLLLFSVLLVLLYPGEDLFDPFDIPRKGEISNEDILAPFRITIFKSDQELAREKERERSGVPYVLVYDSTVPAQVLKRLDRFTAVADSMRQAGTGVSPDQYQERVQKISDMFPRMSRSAIERSLRPDTDLKALRRRLKEVFEDDIYRIGVLEAGANIPIGGSRLVMVRRGDRSNSYQRSEIIGAAEVYARFLSALNRLAARDSIDVDYYYNVGKSLIRPNLKLDLSDYNERLQQAYNQISPIERVVEENDVIVRAGQQVTADQEKVLEEMAKTQRRLATEQGWFTAALPLIGRIILVLAAFSALYLFLYYFRRTIFMSNPKLLALFMVFGLQFSLIWIAGQVADLLDIASIYIYPVAFLPIIITILFDTEIGILSTVVLAVLLGIMHRFSFSIGLLTTAVGFVSCFTSRHVYKRSHFYRIMFALIVTYVVLILIVESLKLTPNPEIATEVAYGVATGIVTIILVTFFLPIFESLFGFTTQFTLLELSDLNHPLLKRLALEAPGTYHHSIVVSNLCEAAAEAIGANSLLARVGAYYHDIGKMEIPEYFVENQLSLKSKHEVLTPSMSSLVLTAHVKKGRWLGEEAGIPDDVLNFIEEHHGTMVMSYFYDKAIKQGADPSEVDKYRYPGPKPQTRETGISMLADAVEAASRTLEDPKPARIHNLIQRIINDRFQSGELNECPLTLRDLARIKDAFAKVLMAAFHQRVAYPNQDKED